MARSLLLVSCLAFAVATESFSALARAQEASPLAGVWTLDRSLGELPRDIGFAAPWLNADGPGAAAPAAGGRGRQGGGGGRGAGTNPFTARPESYDDARRLQVVTEEARIPPVRQIVVDTPATVTITNELGQSRVLHPDGREEMVELQGVPVGVTSKRDAGRLVVVYHAGQGRDVRYTYSYTAGPPHLVVEVQFLEHGTGDKARRVYAPGSGTEALASSGAAAPTPGSSLPKPAQTETFDQRPGAELRGLKTLGLLVEELSAQAVSCGLSRDVIEGAVSKRLTDGGFAVRKNTDDDTYVYVNVITSRLAAGTCVSRYDAFLYSYATTTLSHHDRPVLVQVSLLHRGGLDSNVPSAHAASVVRGLENFVDLFVTQIHDANK